MVELQPRLPSRSPAPSERSENFHEPKRSRTVSKFFADGFHPAPLAASTRSRRLRSSGSHCAHAAPCCVEFMQQHHWHETQSARKEAAVPLTMWDVSRLLIESAERKLMAPGSSDQISRTTAPGPDRDQPWQIRTAAAPARLRRFQRFALKKVMSTTTNGTISAAAVGRTPISTDSSRHKTMMPSATMVCGAAIAIGQGRSAQCPNKSTSGNTPISNSLLTPRQVICRHASRRCSGPRSAAADRLHRLPRQRIGPGNHRLTRDDGCRGRQHDQRQQQYFRTIRSRNFDRGGIGKHQRALTEIIDAEARATRNRATRPGSACVRSDRDRRRAPRRRSPREIPRPASPVRSFRARAGNRWRTMD